MKIVAQMARNRNSSRLGRVLVLAMASLRFHVLPTVTLDSLDEVADLHASLKNYCIVSAQFPRQPGGA